jgi:hypothetical protein
MNGTLLGTILDANPSVPLQGQSSVLIVEIVVPPTNVLLLLHALPQHRSGAGMVGVSSDRPNQLPMVNIHLGMMKAPSSTQ